MRHQSNSGVQRSTTLSSWRLQDCRSWEFKFRHWFFFSTGGWSRLTSPHKSLSSWKMSTILFCRTCFQTGCVCTRRSVLHHQATYYLAENSTQPALPRSRPGIKLQLRLLQLSDPVVPWGGNGSHTNTCAGSFTGESQDIVHLLYVPSEGVACYSAPQHTIKFTRMSAHSCIFWSLPALFLPFYLDRSSVIFSGLVLAF